LAAWAVIMQVIVPVVKGINFLVFSEAVAPHRLRGVGLLGLFVFGFISVMSIPVSLVTYTEGVVWTVGGGQVTAGASGFVKKVLHPSNTDIEVNQPLFKLEDTELKAQHEIAKYKLNELNAQCRAEERQNRVKAAMIRDDLDSVQAEYNQLSSRLEKLTVTSNGSGKFVSSSMRDFAGHYVHKGDVLGHIINPENIIIKAVIPQSRIGLLETYDTSVDFKLANNIGTTYESKIVRKTPQATSQLTSPVLGTAGGGIFAVDSSDKSGTKLLTPAFQIDLSLPENLHLNQIGNRVYVRLNHGSLPIGGQIALSFNQLFLRHFYGK